MWFKKSKKFMRVYIVCQSCGVVEIKTIGLQGSIQNFCEKLGDALVCDECGIPREVCEMRIFDNKNTVSIPLYKGGK